MRDLDLGVVKANQTQMSRALSTVSKTAVFALLASTIAITSLLAKRARSFPVRVDRWLSIQQVAGNVFFQSNNFSGQAKVGHRLQSVGDGVKTGKGASSTLIIDTGVGVIQISENTTLRIRALDMASDNGRITRLQITGGQARFQIRKFTHRGSQLEIQTPAGLTGVRGTEFGVGVQPTGKTGIAARSGAVVTTAQNQSVFLPAGTQNFIIPGEQPSQAVPLQDNTDLKAEFVRSFTGDKRRVNLVGRVDPVNSVLVDGQPVSTNRQGEFSVDLPAIFRLRVNVQVITPLGKQQVHELEFM